MSTEFLMIAGFSLVTTTVIASWRKHWNAFCIGLVLSTVAVLALGYRAMGGL